MAKESDLLSILEQLESFGTKRKPKMALLESCLAQDNSAIKQVMQMTYEKKKNYYLTVDLQEDSSEPVSKPIFGKKRPEDVFHELTNILSLLSSRQLSGDAARKSWKDFMSVCSPLEKKWFSRIVNRDLKIGLNEKSLLKICPGIISDFGCQLAVDIDKMRSPINGTSDSWKTFPVLLEPKIDGMRVLFTSTGACSREGNDLPTLDYAVQELRNAVSMSLTDDYMLDCEAIASNQWNKTISLVKDAKIGDPERKQTLRFKVFDISSSYYNKLALSARRSKLEALRSSLPAYFEIVDAVECASMEEVMEAHDRNLDAGYEGSMLKFPKADYVSERSERWLKLKPVATVDSVIIGFEKGKIGSKNQDRLGAFVCRRLDTDAVVRVGGGLSDSQRDTFFGNRKDLLGTILEFKEQGNRNGVAVTSFPRFVRLRTDREKQTVENPIMP